MMIRSLIAAALLATTAAANVEPGFYEHPLHGGGTAFIAHVAITGEPNAQGEVEVTITVDGHETVTTGTAEGGSIVEMEPTVVKGGHEIRVVKGKRLPRSKRAGNAFWKVMKEASPYDPHDLPPVPSGSYPAARSPGEDIGTLPGPAASD